MAHPIGLLFRLLDWSPATVYLMIQRKNNANVHRYFFFVLDGIWHHWINAKATWHRLS